MNCIANYKTFLTIYYLNKNKILILNYYSPKYNWLNVYEKKNFISFNYLFVNTKQSFKKFVPLKKNNIYNIIEFKRKFCIFKKNSDYNYFILNYANQLKINYDKLINYSKQKQTIKFFNNKKYNIQPQKTIDLSKKIKLLFKNNRKILKSFFNLKYYRNFSLSKNIKKLSKFGKNDMLYNMENNILNIIMKSDIFISLNDCKWFLKNSLISVNSNIVKNEKFLIKPLDVINITYNNAYFFLYKESFYNSINKLYRISLKLWSINKNRAKNSKIKENYPLWLDNYKYYKKDIPINMEVDYLTMTIIILYFDWKSCNLNYINTKFVNIYLNRLYNWKYII